MKQLLVRQAFVEAGVVPLGRTRTVALRVTDRAQEVLGIRPKTVATKESLIHEWWKARLSREYTQDGWRVEVEGIRDPSRPELGRADLVLTKEAERWAVEVETGKSDVVANVRNGLLAGLGRILIVPTSDEAHGLVERQVGRESLLVEPRGVIWAKQRR